MGERDLFKRVLDERAFELSFWRARIRPGTPVSFGRLPRPGRPPLPVFGLPGNPGSAFVTFHLFVWPFLRRMLGDPRPGLPSVRAVAGHPFRSPGHLTHFFRVRLEGAAPLAISTGPQGSGLVRNLARADGLMILPEGTTEVQAGDGVDVLLLPERGAWAP